MKTILLIDDDQRVRMTFGITLRNAGYHVIEAASGVAGLELARLHLPDMILSDIHMPDGDGSVLLREIRHDPELRSKQVVLMTGSPALVTPRKGMEEGADDFLVKPVTLEALLNCVEARFHRASISWRVEDEMLAQLYSRVPSQLHHEFFTPLAGIIGLVEILRDDFASLTPADVKDILTDVYQSSLRLHRTLRNYLLILNFPTAPDEPVPPLPPPEVKESIQAGIDAALRQNQRQEDVILRAHAGCSLSIQPEDLSRMVEELVDNACKFSRQGTPLEVDLHADGRLIIEDKGRGLTPEEVDRIGAFRQFDRKKYEQQGLGLGLVLVQKLAAQCEAKFAINSWSGKGTQVQIAFPLANGT